MKIKSKKEIQPVVFGEYFIKALRFNIKEKNFLCFETHWHERMEILRIEKGALKATIDDTAFECTT